jgi:ankyrin repeat protein
VDEDEIFGELLDAISRGDVREVGWILKSGLNVDTVDYDGRTPLMIASESGQCFLFFICLLHFHFFVAVTKCNSLGKLECAKFLVSLGTNINITDRWGYTALECARRQGHAHIVEYLAAQSSKDGMMGHRSNEVLKAVWITCRRRRGCRRRRRCFFVLFFVIMVLTLLF